MARWAETDRGLAKAVALFTLVAYAVMAIAWSLWGAAVVLVPIGIAAMVAIAVGGWLHEYPRVDR